MTPLDRLRRRQRLEDGIVGAVGFLSGTIIGLFATGLSDCF